MMSGMSWMNCDVRPSWRIRPSTVVVTASIFPFPPLRWPGLIMMTGFSFMPKDDQSEFEVAVIMPEGFSLDRSDALCKEIEGKLKTVRGVTNVFTTIGETNGRSPKGQGDVTKVTIYCRMTDLTEREFGQRVGDLRHLARERTGQFRDPILAFLSLRGKLRRQVHGRLVAPRMEEQVDR